ncbi:MAG: GAF domain-containing protein [Nitrososphaerales archaeon]
MASPRLARYNAGVEPVLIATLDRINALTAEVNRLDGDDAAALDWLLRQVEAAAAALVDGSVASILLGEWPAAEPEDEAGSRAITLPLGAVERPFGMLTVVLPAGQTLDRGQELLLHSLANVAATALAQAGVRRDSQRTLARKEDELTLLRRAGLLISSRTGLQDTLDTILQMALEVTGARYGIFRLVDKGRNALVMAAIAGEDLGRPAVEALPINVTSVMGMVAKTRQPVMIADVRQPPWSRIYYPLDHALQMRAELAVPLLGAGGRLVGVLNLESPQPGAFSEADSHLLQSLASQAVIAIQEVRLLDALRDTSARVLTEDVGRVHEHLQAVREELLSGDTEWDRKVEAILAQYEHLARESAERQEALREAREARAIAETFAAMGDVAANLLHHLNNQVGTIPARVEGIQDKCRSLIARSPYLAANLAEIERAALDAMQTVRERLALLRPITPSPVSVADCLADALRAARLPANVTVTSSSQLATLPPVLAGHEGLTLALLNLIDNAGEALGRGGRIEVSGAAHGGIVEVAVADDGPGIPPEMQSRIFEFDVSSRRAGKGHRMGFGLWWVKTLITRIGGAITVESDGKTGTTFRLRLPKGE